MDGVELGGRPREDGSGRGREVIQVVVVVRGGTMVTREADIELDRVDAKVEYSCEGGHGGLGRRRGHSAMRDDLEHHRRVLPGGTPILVEAKSQRYYRSSRSAHA